MFIHLSLHESKAKVLGMPSPEMKNEFTLCYQIINSLESVGMEGTDDPKYRGSIVVLSISKSVEPDEEQKEMTSGFQ